MKKTAIVILAAIALFSFKPVAESIWKSDRSHSNIKFTISHMMISDVEGSFKNFEAKITATKDDFSDAVVEFTGDVNSIDTENADRDKHLKAPDFFDAAKYPTFSFKSTEFKKIADKKYAVTGNLTLHGVTKPIALEATYRGTIDHPYTKKKVAGFKVTGVINRTDFGIATSYASAMLGEEVSFTANAEFVKE